MRLLFQLLLISSLTLLNGCVSLRLADNAANPKNVRIQSPSARIKQLQRITQWQISGALSLHLKNKTSLANYRWQQYSRSRYRIHLSSSLNLYVLDIIGQSGAVTINDNKQHTHTGQSPAALVKQLIGYPLPVNDLYYWIRSLAAPGPKTTHYDPYGHLVDLQQQGWRLHFSRFISVKHVDLPQMIDITSPTLNMRIVIKHWNF